MTEPDSLSGPTWRGARRSASVPVASLPCPRCARVTLTSRCRGPSPTGSPVGLAHVAPLPCPRCARSRLASWRRRRRRRSPPPADLARGLAARTSRRTLRSLSSLRSGSRWPRGVAAISPSRPLSRPPAAPHRFGFPFLALGGAPLPYPPRWRCRHRAIRAESSVSSPTTGNLKVGSDMSSSLKAIRLPHSRLALARSRFNPLRGFPSDFDIRLSLRFRATGQVPSLGSSIEPLRRRKPCRP